MRFINFGQSKGWDIETMKSIADQIYDYVTSRGYTNVLVTDIEDNHEFDKVNGRYDITIVYNKGQALCCRQLLYLKGEIVDGDAFHKRFEEFYPKGETWEDTKHC